MIKPIEENIELLENLLKKHLKGFVQFSEKDDNVKSIYYREVPNVIFVDNDDDLALQKTQKQGYTFVKLNKNSSVLSSPL